MDSELPSPEGLAKFMHERRARLAVELGCTGGRGLTPPEIRCTWESLPEEKRALLVAVAKRTLDFIRFGLDRAWAEAVAARIPLDPKGKMYLTKAGFAELARRGLVRCKACESWDEDTRYCSEPKLCVDVSDQGNDGIGLAEESTLVYFGPDFGCIHFSPKATEETDGNGTESSD